METAVLWVVALAFGLAWSYEFRSARFWYRMAETRLKTAEHWQRAADGFKAAFEEQCKLFDDAMKNHSCSVITRAS